MGVHDGQEYPLTEDQFLQDTIKVVFQFHDTIQEYPKTPVRNEIESADLLAKQMNDMWATDGFHASKTNSGG